MTKPSRHSTPTRHSERSEESQTLRLRLRVTKGWLRVTEGVAQGDGLGRHSERSEESQTLRLRLRVRVTGELLRLSRRSQQGMLIGTDRKVG